MIKSKQVITEIDYWIATGYPKKLTVIGRLKEDLMMNEYNVEVLQSDEYLILMMRGEQTKETVINSAIAANQIEECDRATWLSCDDMEVGYYKAVPKAEYSIYYSPSTEETNGAFQATCLILY